jgi:hypothetical protein
MRSGLYRTVNADGSTSRPGRLLRRSPLATGSFALERAGEPLSRYEVGTETNTGGPRYVA